ncbi:ComEC/Rec2 family competence protein [Patescibacteria group bacterium]|nr:ComEC/Rec2 family competence protein [Patescibacteria group bacterium]
MIAKLLGSLALGFIVGVLIHSIFFSFPISYLVLIIIFLVGFFVSMMTHKVFIVLVGVGIIGIAFGLLRFTVQIDEQSSQILDVFVQEQEQIVVYGHIASEPVVHPSYTEFMLDTRELITYAELTLPVATRILVKTDIYTNYEYGQGLIVKGTLEKPEAFVTDTERIFDYESYLVKDGIYYIMNYAEAMVFDEGSASIQRGLYRIKRAFLDRIYHFIPEPESGFLAGILFGEKSALGDDWEEKFRIVGLMHIVVLSGYNVSLVIHILTKIFHFLPRSIRSLLAVLSIAGFALLVGAGPTVIRASIMAVFIVLADVIGARYNIIRALFVAGVLMVVWNPMVLYFDISFQLSFLATYGLIMLSPKVEQWFRFLPRFFTIRESATATVSAQIMVLPLILYKIGDLSIISPLVNVLVLFMVPFSMLIGFITSLCGMLAPSIATIFAFITVYALKYQLWIVDVFATLPFSHITVPPFHWVFMLLAYVFIFWWIHRIIRLSHLEI